MNRPLPIASDILAFRALPEIAQALRARKEVILARWQETVKQVLPDANPLTREQVRDTIPIILDHLISALESAEPARVQELAASTRDHGKVRFDQDYDVREFLTEYRILSQIVLDEVGQERGGKLTRDEARALVAGLDISAEVGTVNFVSFLMRQLRSAAEGEIRFISFLSHDLRNNLNLVMLTQELLGRRLKQYPELAQEARDLETAQKTARSTIDGMERLLQAERLRGRTEPAKQQPVDLRALLEEVASQFGPQAQEKSIRIETVAPEAATIRTDPEILSIILRNLVGNAIKYSTGGVVRLEARAPGAPNAPWSLSVSDQGPGIPPEHQQRIFEGFQRGETYGQKGVGLGLYIALQSARLLRAHLSLQSEVGRGSTFTLTLHPR